MHNNTNLTHSQTTTPPTHPRTPIQSVIWPQLEMGFSFIFTAAQTPLFFQPRALSHPEVLIRRDVHNASQSTFPLTKRVNRGPICTTAGVLDWPAVCEFMVIRGTFVMAGSLCCSHRGLWVRDKHTHTDAEMHTHIYTHLHAHAQCWGNGVC